MKTFVMQAKIEFEAENIDDAFRLLEAHFDYLQRDMPDVEPPLQFTGEIRIRPLIGESPHYEEIAH